MDYIIFRKAENDFMRFTDGQIFVTADNDEIEQEFLAETESGAEPIVLSLSYEHYFDSEMNEHQKVTIFDGDEKIGMFTYPSHFDNDDAFFEELEEWAEDYINDKQ